MDLAEIKASYTGGYLIGDEVEWLIAEVERLTEQIKAGMQPLANKMSEYAAENQRLTALCDGYRGDIDELRSCESVVKHSSQYQKGYDAGRCFERQLHEAALTRARAEGMEEAIKSVEDVPTTVSVYPTFEQARGATTAKAQIIAAIRARGTKGDSAEACRLAEQAEKGE